MMDLIRTWLLGVAGAALVAALADSLAPEGAVKKAGKLACGLLLAIAMLQPLLGLDYAALAGAFADYRLEGEGYSAALETENHRLMKIIIAEQTSAYIQDKAAELGVACTAEVTCLEDGNGDPYPASAVVYGELTPAQSEQLTRIIEGDLAIPVQAQRYERTKEP